MSKTNAKIRPTQRSEMTKMQWTWKEMKRNKTAYFMLAPFFILFIIFTVLPVFLSMLLSLTDFNMLQMPHWKGISNYTRLFLEDEIFILAIQNTLIFAAVTGPVSYLLSLLWTAYARSTRSHLTQVKIMGGSENWVTDAGSRPRSTLGLVVPGRPDQSLLLTWVK